MRSKQRRSRSWVSRLAATVKIFPPKTIGEACPLPGSGERQRIFSVLLQWVGKELSVLRPSPCGPRH